MNENKLAVIDGETLMDMRLPKAKFCVSTLLPQGLCILGGASKIGKSWLVLDLCLRVAKGEPVWNLPTEKGTALYLCLEDTLRRVQERLNLLTDDVPPNVFFATSAWSIADGLCEQIGDFVKEHPDTSLVVIDTFQIVRNGAVDTSYANDYEEVRTLKKLADTLGICLLLVHHIRKQEANDPLNKLTGTTGISGAADAIFVLDKSKRSAAGATMFCTGRDIEYRELELNFSKENVSWELVSDTMENPELLLPSEMLSLSDFMKEEKCFEGTNTELTERFNSYSGRTLTPKSLKQQMNKWRYPLEERGVFFESKRSNGLRMIKIFFSSVNSDASAVSDANTGCAKTCVPCVPCDPVGGVNAPCRR